MVRPFSIRDLPVLTGRQSASFDALAIRELGVPEAALMERAGAGAAALIQELAPSGPVLVLAGKGNNGGDALVVARCLRAWGREVEVLLTADRPAMDPLLHGWPVPVGRTGSLGEEALRARLDAALSREGVIVDGILGTGIKGAPRGEAGRVVALLEAGTTARDRLPSTVTALDIPSGVDADTGEVPGPAVRAQVTVSFGWPKLGTLLHPGRGVGGRLVVLEIGFPPLPPDLGTARALTPAWAAEHRPDRPPVTHKNQVGALAVVAGRPGMAGAAVLAARSALRSGAGFVRVITHPGNREIVQSAVPEAVFVDASDAEAVDASLGASRAVAVGPGMGTGPAAAELLERVLGHALPRVVDADALTLLSASRGLRDAAYGAGTVITPHPGEADRLLGGGPDVPGDRLDVIRALRGGTETVVLLKGAPSLVLGDLGLWVETVGTSDLAVAGMGDTLTGAVGSFLAQGCAPQVAAGLALVVTGRAAARAARGTGLQAADVPEHLPDALNEGEGQTDLRLPGVLLDLDPPR